jgi:hypothetical protein
MFLVGIKKNEERVRRDILNKEKINLIENHLISLLPEKITVILN